MFEPVVAYLDSTTVTLPAILDVKVLSDEVAASNPTNLFVAEEV